MATLNANPTVYHAKETNTAARKRRHIHGTTNALLHDGQHDEGDEAAVEPWTAEEVFGEQQHITDARTHVRRLHSDRYPL
jgi:hypothetical protein